MDASYEVNQKTIETINDVAQAVADTVVEVVETVVEAVEEAVETAVKVATDVVETTVKVATTITEEIAEKGSDILLGDKEEKNGDPLNAQENNPAILPKKEEDDEEGELGDEDGDTDDLLNDKYEGWTDEEIMAEYSVTGLYASNDSDAAMVQNSVYEKAAKEEMLAELRHRSGDKTYTEIMLDEEIYNDTEVTWVAGKGRKLFNDEIEEMEQIFGDSVDYEKVTINKSEKGPCADGNVILLSSDELKEDSSIYEIKDTQKQFLAHEMTHVWQAQTTSKGAVERESWNISMIAGVKSLIKDHEWDDSSKYHTHGVDEKTNFYKLNIEQQATIVTMYYNQHLKKYDSSETKTNEPYKEVVTKKLIEDYIKNSKNTCKGKLRKDKNENIYKQ